jgi:RHS repeat-associated protein
MLKRIVGFGNSGTNATESQSRVFEYDYAPVAVEGSNNLARTSPRMVVEKLKGYEVARTYYIYRPGTNVTIQCTRTNAPVDASDNLFTTNWVRALSMGTKEITRLQDGLFQFSTTLTNSVGTYQTRIVSSGVADFFEFSIVEGTETTTVMEKNGPVISRTTRAIPSNVIRAQETYEDPDTYKRMRSTTFVLDGTSNYTAYAECCGQTTFKDRDGVITSHTHDARKRLLTTTHIGITTSNVYDAAGAVLETWRYGSNGPPIKLGSSTYDRAGRLKTSVDGMTNTTTYNYSFDAGTGRSKTTITYPDGGTRIEYQNKDGTLSEIAGTAAVPLTYTYDIEAEGGLHRAYTLETRSPATEWLKKYADMAGRTYKEVYSAASAPYPTTESFYDNKGRLVKQITFGSVTNIFIYNALGEVEYSGTDMNADGQLTTASSDRVVRTVRDYSTNNGVHFERLITIGYTTIGTSDLITNAVSETSSSGLHSWRSGPGFTNKSYTVINAATMTRTVYSTNADGAYTITTNIAGRLTGVGQFAANGTLIGSTAFAYDSHGRQFKVIDGRAGTEIVSLFNNADQVVTNSVNAPGLPSQITVNFYDNMSRVWRVMHPDATSVTNEYYVTGLLKKTYGSRTYPVEYKYDAQGRMTNMTTWQSYPSGGAANTAWFYDGYRGWLTNKLDAAGKGAVYAYTPAGSLQSRSWARGTNTTYTYNAAGQLTGIDYSDVTPDVNITYDRRGRQTGITQGGATTSQIFNDAGQLLSQTANGLTVSNRYDLYFRRTNSGVWNGSAWLARTEYTYDNASRLQKVGDGTNSATYAYLANSSLIDAITFSENAATRMTTTKTWDSLNRLKKIESVVGGSPVSSHAYGYNAANQRMSVTNADNARWMYDYDELGQVTSGKKYWGDGTIVAGQQFEYDFDDIGNRKYAGSGGNEWGSNLRYANYTVNNLNQYSQRTAPPHVNVLGSARTNANVTVNDTPTYRKGEYFRAEVETANGAGAFWLSLTNLAVLQNGSNPDIVTNTVGNLFVPTNPETFTYDLDGNQTSDGRWTNRWDAENRLIAVESLGTTPDGAKRKLVFAYDWQGRRTSKIVSNLVSGSWVLARNVRFVYDQWNLLAELNATNNAVINSFMWGLDLSDTEHGAGGVGGLLAVKSAGNGTHFYAFDANGNVATLTSSTNGTVTAEYEYDPFLNPLRVTGPMAHANCFKGSAKYWDHEIGSYYYGHRYYNASSGRWLNRDPIQESGGLGLYTFVFNNAEALVDRDGRAVFRPLPIPISPPQTVLIPVVPPGLTPAPNNPASGSLNSPAITWTDPVAAPELEAIRTKSKRKASDACFNLANKKPGKNQYFYANANHQRAMGAAAVLWKKDPKPRSRWVPPGFRAASHHPRLSVDRGHLIPRVYGGKADEENIVTQESDYNQGRFREILEYKLDRLLPEGSKCNWVCIAVIPKYEPRWKPVPIGFHITIVHRFESSNYEHFFDLQPAIDGNLDYDMPPWRDMNLGWSRLNYELLQ